MTDQQQFKYSTGVFAYPMAFVMLIWTIFWIQVRFVHQIKSFGIVPLTFKGLRGIFFSPFIHGDISHIYHNTIPVFILMMALFYFYRPIAWKVLLYGVLLSGVITWVIGRPATHIGASGLIYVLVSFVFFKGIFAKHYRLIALSLMVIFLYGSMIWYVFPVEEGISWEGHLGGLITGILFAVIFRNTVAKPEKYHWEQPNYNADDDPFLRHFDVDGNFIEHIEPEVGVDVKTEIESVSRIDEAERGGQEPLKITYTFKKSEENGEL